MDPILVTGGTGTLGRLVVERLRAAGHDVRVMSRSATGQGAVRGDLDTGEGVAAALAGVRTVVHCAGASKGDEVKALTLVRAARAAGVGHVVNISVVGADRTPVKGRADRAMFGYVASKLAAERVIAESGIPWTTLRATQFHDLMLTTAEQMAKLPVVPAPAGVRVQPVEAAEVADRLAELAPGEARGLVEDIGGPRVYAFGDLVRSYLRAAGRRRLVVPLPLPGRAARAFRAGANLAPEQATGRRTWEAFLAERVTRPGRAPAPATPPAPGPR
jgi:uncharacterized protein YbjT (DUF2867 family)